MDASQIAVGNIYKTRGGNFARLYAIDGGGDHPVHGAWFNELEGKWNIASWSNEGFFVNESFPRTVDLVEIVNGV